MERLAACVGGTKDVMLGCTGNDLSRVSHGAGVSLVAVLRDGDVL